MKLDKLTLTTLVTILIFIAAAVSGAAMGKHSERFSPTLHSTSRLEADEQMLGAHMQKLRRHLRHGASQSEVALERAQIHRDWQDIVVERGSKPAELSSRLATFGPSWRFSSPRHLKKNQA